MQTPRLQPKSLRHGEWGDYTYGIETPSNSTPQSPPFSTTLPPRTSDVGAANLPNAKNFPLPAEHFYALAAGDTAFTVEGGSGDPLERTRWYCVWPGTVGGADAVWAKVPVKSPEGYLRRSYGDTTLRVAGLPVPFSIEDSSNRHLYDAWSNYDRCKVRVRAVDGSGNVFYTDEQSFANHTAIDTWLTGSPAAGAYTVFAEVEDEIDVALAPPSKVYGVNTAWTNLVRGKYWDPQYSSFEGGFNGAGTRWAPDFVPPLAMAANNLWTTYGGGAGIGIPTLTGSLPFAQFFWASKTNHHRRYDLPGFRPDTCVIQASGGRTAWNTSTSSFVAASGDFEYDPQSEGPVYFHVPVSGPARWKHLFDVATLTPGPPPTADRCWRELLGGASAPLLFYPLRSTTNHRIKAIYVKPVGIDTVMFAPFDIARYRLEAVGTHRNDKRPRLMPLALGADYLRRSTTPLHIGALMKDLAGQQNKWGLGSWSTALVRFQYRDLLTNRVSPLSSPQVTTKTRKRGVEFAWYVVNSSEV